MRLLVFSYFVSMYIKPLWRNLQRFFFCYFNFVVFKRLSAIPMLCQC